MKRTMNSLTSLALFLLMTLSMAAPSEASLWVKFLRWQGGNKGPGIHAYNGGTYYAEGTYSVEPERVDPDPAPVPGKAAQLRFQHDSRSIGPYELYLPSSLRQGHPTRNPTAYPVEDSPAFR